MAIQDICSKSVVTVERDEKIKKVAELMRRHHVGSIIVTEIRRGKCIPVGMVTDRDIVVEIVAKGVDVEQVTAEDIMSRDLTAVKNSTGIFDVLKTMRRSGVGRAPVVDSRGDLVGLISTDDFVGMLADELNQVSKLKRKQIRTEKQSRT